MVTSYNYKNIFDSYSMYSYNIKPSYTQNRTILSLFLIFLNHGFCIRIVLRHTVDNADYFRPKLMKC